MTNRMPGDSGHEHSDAGTGSSHAQRISRLFSEHNESLIQFLATRLRSVQEAKEVAQEAYVRLLSLEDSGAVSFLRAFLFKTAANLAVDRIRSRNRQRQALDAGLCDESREAPTPDREAASVWAGMSNWTTCERSTVAAAASCAVNRPAHASTSARTACR